jgi:hypothetical protein
MSINIGEILVRAGQIFWKHKVLWIFGILASCTANGFSGGGNSNYSFSSGDTGTLPSGVQDAVNQAFQNPALAVGILLLAVTLICLLVLLFLALAVMGRIGLITGAQKADGGAERLTFQEVFQASKPYFLRVFGLKILFGLAGFVGVLLFVVMFVIFAAATLGLGVLCLIPLICLLVPLAWLVAVIIEQAEIAIVIEDRDIPGGLSRGWQVINANWGPVIVMALILMLGSAVVSVLLALPFFLLAFPTMLAFFAGGPSAQQTALIALLVCGCLYVPILIFANGLVQTYYHSAWTLTFLRLTGRGPEPAQPEESPVPPQLEPLDA